MYGMYEITLIKGSVLPKQKVDDVLHWPLRLFLTISAVLLLGGKVLTHGEESVFTLSLLIPRDCSPCHFCFVYVCAFGV